MTIEIADFSLIAGLCSTAMLNYQRVPGYPLVNGYRTRWKDSPFFLRKLTSFRLGHGFSSKLWVITRGYRIYYVSYPGFAGDVWSSHWGNSSWGVVRTFKFILLRFVQRWSHIPSKTYKTSDRIDLECFPDAPWIYGFFTYKTGSLFG